MTDSLLGFLPWPFGEAGFSYHDRVELLPAIHELWEIVIWIALSEELEISYSVGGFEFAFDIMSVASRA